MKPINDKKPCSRCKKIKTLDEFHTDKRRKDGRTSECRLCSEKWNAEYRRTHKEKIKETIAKWRLKNTVKVKTQNKEWKSTHAEKVKEMNASWRDDNLTKVREQRNIIAAKHRKTLKGKLNNNMSCRMRYSLKGEKNNHHWESLVDFTWNQLKKHLEKQFKQGMAWNNYGLWHVDHKIPIKAFNYEKSSDIDFKKCWALKNLQPMWATDNIKKKDKILRPFQPSLLLEAV